MARQTSQQRDAQLHVQWAAQNDAMPCSLHTSCRLPTFSGPESGASVIGFGMGITKALLENSKGSTA
eukprot:1161847-Pelagomonas_calceolata.AAC.2